VRRSKVRIDGMRPTVYEIGESTTNVVPHLVVGRKRA
jgi:hypothetical protein